MRPREQEDKTSVAKSFERENENIKETVMISYDVLERNRLISGQYKHYKHYCTVMIRLWRSKFKEHTEEKYTEI